MSEQPTETPDSPDAFDSVETVEDEETPDEQQPRRSLMTLVSILLLVVLVLLVLLMLRECGSTNGLTTRGAKTIVEVEGATPIAGVISVWVEDGTNLLTALERAGISHSGITDLEDGRYLVVVPQGVEQEAARQLAEQPGVYDVGRVYESE